MAEVHYGSIVYKSGILDVEGGKFLQMRRLGKIALEDAANEESTNKISISLSPTLLGKGEKGFEKLVYKSGVSTVIEIKDMFCLKR